MKPSSEEFDMDSKTPIHWDVLEPVRAAPRLLEIFENHREEAIRQPTLEAAVDRLYQIRHEKYEIGAPDQGVAYVFAYLLEKTGQFDAAGMMTSIDSRRPDDDTLGELFWEQERVPWWIAVEYGVHYSLVMYWLWEADIPLMRRNIPDEQFEKLDFETAAD